MAEEIGYTNITNIPEMVKLAVKVQATRKPHILRVDGEDIAVLIPPPSQKSPKAQEAKDVDRSGTKALLTIAHMGLRGGDTHLSENIDHYLYGAPKKR